LDQLARLGRSHTAIALRVPHGTDPIGWAAHAHLKSPRKDGPLVLADATNPLERTLDYFQDGDRSPPVLADGGTLLLLAVALLALDVQEHVFQTLSRRASEPARSSLSPPGLIVTARAPIAELAGEGHVLPALARWIGDAQISIPGLADRA